jgi:ribose-phosphate pyrophosphokinase
MTRAASAAPTDLVLHAFPDSARFGRALAQQLGLQARPIACHRFPDRESLVRVRVEPARRAIVVRSLHDPNAKLVELELAADALRRSGARRLTLVAPYLCYMRQDAAFHPGEPISQRVVGEMLSRAFDRVITVEPHLHRTPSLRQVFSVPATAISAAPALAEWISRGRGRPLVVGPDEESLPWIRSIARLAGLPALVGHKVRVGDARVRVRFPPFDAERRAVIVDDIASSGATLAAAARELRRGGVRHVDVAVVHGLFAPGALGRLRRAGVGRVASCDTVPHRTNAIRVAPLVARPFGRT